jgi:hypothetical protein
MMRPASLFALSLLSLLLAVVGSVVGAPPLYAAPPVAQQPPPVPPFSAGSIGERAQPVPPQVVGSGVPDASLQSPTAPPPTAAPVPSAGGGAASSEKSTRSRPEIIFSPVAFLSNPVSGPIPQEHVIGGCY